MDMQNINETIRAVNEKYGLGIEPIPESERDENDLGLPETPKKIRREDKTGRLVEVITSSGAILFLDQLNEPHIAPRGDGTEVFPIMSSQFDDWIAYLNHLTHQSVGDETVSKVKRILCFEAKMKGQVRELSVRVARDKSGAIWYDLGKKAVRTDANGWEVVEKPPILFRRFRHQKIQVDPVHGGNIAQILEFTNVKSDHDRVLLMTYLVSCFIPDFPHPVLIIHGQQGAAKSTLFRLLKRLIDPSAISTISPTKDKTQFVQQISHHWFSPLDNLSGLTTEISDTICRACTGEGFSKRKLYSNDDDHIYSIKHVIGLNGIANVASKSDLLDRSILIELIRISEEARKDEEEINKDFEQALPRILGACFDILSLAIKHRPNIRLEKKPRMADFTKWGVSITEAMGLGGNAFIEAYDSNIEKQNTEAIANSPIGPALMSVIEQELTGELEVTPAELLYRLNNAARNEGMEPQYIRNWPKDPGWMSRKDLKEISPNLEKAGIRLEFSKGIKRLIKITDEKKYAEYVKNSFSAGDAIDSKDAIPPKPPVQPSIGLDS